MKLPIEPLALFASAIRLTTAAPADVPPADLQSRDLPFRSLRGLTKLTHDHTASEAFSHPNKFFHESTFSGHYDGRFADAELPDSTRIHHLRLLLASYLSTMERIGVRTWLMHGCLLGWWWNGQIMPWDNDVDVMVDEKGIAELGGWWNMSVHHFTADDLRLYKSLGFSGTKTAMGDVSREKLHEEVIKDGKKYLLEVNPNYLNTSTRDKENVIDARWIDTSTGVFIDITTIHVQPIPATTNQPDGMDDNDEEEDDDLELYTKDQHAYSYSQVFPLRTSTIEGLDVHVPYDYEGLLLDEYGPKAITHKWFRGWKFDDNLHMWIAAPEGEAERQYAMSAKPDNKGGMSKKQDPSVYLMRGRERAAVGRAHVQVP